MRSIPPQRTLLEDASEEAGPSSRDGRAGVSLLSQFHDSSCLISEGGFDFGGSHSLYSVASADGGSRILAYIVVLPYSLKASEIFPT